MSHLPSAHRPLIGLHDSSLLEAFFDHPWHALQTHVVRNERVTRTRDSHVAPPHSAVTRRRKIVC